MNKQEAIKIGRAHVWTPVTATSRMPSSAWKKKKEKNKKKKSKKKKKKSGYIKVTVEKQHHDARDVCRGPNKEECKAYDQI